MAKKKSLKMEDFVRMASSKRLNTEEFVWSETPNIIYEIGGLNELELLYLEEEIGKAHESMNAISLTMTIALGVKNIYIMEDNEKIQLDIKWDENTILGKAVKNLPISMIMDIDNLEMKKALFQAIMEKTKLSVKEGAKLELFRKA